VDYICENLPNSIRRALYREDVLDMNSTITDSQLLKACRNVSQKWRVWRCRTDKHSNILVGAGMGSKPIRNHFLLTYPEAD